MNSPIELCMQMLASIQATLQSKMPDLKTWVSVETARDLEASVDLMIGIQGPPAFAIVWISSTVEPDSFSVRFNELQVKSCMWLGDYFRLPDKHEISQILREEFKVKINEGRFAPGPTIILQNNFRRNARDREIVENNSIEIRFQSIDREIDVAKEEDIDYEKLADAIYEDLVTLRRIYEQLRING